MTELRVSDVSKRYGATQALSGLSAQLSSGTVTGIAGPNGAGKSTLLRILAGEENPDAGEILLFRNGQSIRDFKVAVVHQEPQVWPNLTVRKNLAVGRERDASARENIGQDEGEKILGLLDIDVFADFELVDLPLAVHQRVEIARALLHQADVFLFDEPNSALTDEESKSLFELMAKLAASGKIVILVTHRLNDFVNACETVLILRDGRIVAEIGGDAPISETTIVAQLTLTARTTSEFPTATPIVSKAAIAHHEPVLLSLNSCSDVDGAFRQVSLEVRAGKVLVLAGVEGSGARELAQAIGQYRQIDHRPTRGRRVQYVAASRRHTIFPNMSVAENLALRLNDRKLKAWGGFLRYGAIDRFAAACVNRYAIKTTDPENSITSLSGGNQQKVVLAATLETNAEIVVVEEPTRGVDISSKREIYALLKSYCRTGNAVVLFCTEVPEMYDVADDLIVLSRGSISGRLSIADIASVSELVDILAQLEGKEVNVA